MFNKFSNDISEVLKKKVDILTYTSLENSLIRNNIGDEVVLYEQP